MLMKNTTRHMKAVPIAKIIFLRCHDVRDATRIFTCPYSTAALKYKPLATCYNGNSKALHRSSSLMHYSTTEVKKLSAVKFKSRRSINSFYHTFTQGIPHYANPIIHPSVTAPMKWLPHEFFELPTIFQAPPQFLPSPTSPTTLNASPQILS